MSLRWGRNVLLWSGVAALAAAEPARAQGYIEQVQEELSSQGVSLERDREGHRTPYIDSQKQKLLQNDDPLLQESSEGYSERLRQGLPPVEPAGESYSDVERRKLEPPAEGTAAARPSTIAAVLKNEADLNPRYEGDIHFAAGLRYGALLTRAVSGGNGNFNTIYGSSYAPDLQFFGEWQPFHSEWFGSFGVIGGFGLSLFRGYGTYAINLTNPLSGGQFGTTSHTQFFFHALPTTLGISYRFNLLRIVRPFVAASGAFIGYVESRNDGKNAKFDFCLGAHLTGGVAILLDWLEESAMWKAYQASGIRHTYLTAEFGLLLPLMGAVTYQSTGLQAGLAFEF